MRLPLSWLNEFVKVDDIDPKELAEKLTRAGLQVTVSERVWRYLGHRAERRDGKRLFLALFS